MAYNDPIAVVRKALNRYPKEFIESAKRTTEDSFEFEVELEFEGEIVTVSFSMTIG